MADPKPEKPILPTAAPVPKGAPAPAPSGGPLTGTALLEHYHRTGEYEEETRALLAGHEVLIVSDQAHLAAQDRTEAYAYRLRKGEIVRKRIDLAARREALRPQLPEAPAPPRPPAGEAD